MASNVRNKLISEAPNSDGFPNILEPKGLYWIYGKRPEGLSLIPWNHGKALLWDVTVVNTLAPSYINLSSKLLDSVAYQAERRKYNLYVPLEVNHVFTPIAFESLGCMSPDSKVLIQLLGKYMVENTGERKSLNYLLERISIAIQLGECCIHFQYLWGPKSIGDCFYKCNRNFYDCNKILLVHTLAFYNNHQSYCPAEKWQQEEQNLNFRIRVAPLHCQSIVFLFSTHKSGRFL